MPDPHASSSLEERKPTQVPTCGDEAAGVCLGHTVVNLGDVVKELEIKESSEKWFGLGKQKTHKVKLRFNFSDGPGPSTQHDVTPPPYDRAANSFNSPTSITPLTETTTVPSPSTSLFSPNTPSPAPSPSPASQQHSTDLTQPLPPSPSADLTHPPHSSTNSTYFTPASLDHDTLTSPRELSVPCRTATSSPFPPPPPPPPPPPTPPPPARPLPP
eukprot:GHVN01038725.1.p1 GENE.GHVN01038725.1~~GHVN01038725.1.p1  ORF type:complete len:215 (+),score=66.18 GHVN01038725.1:69-713(+)